MATLISIGVCLLIAAGVVVATLGMPLGTARAPGPGFYPLWLGVALGLLGLVLLVDAVRRLRTPEPQAPSFTLRSWGRAAATVAILVAYAALLEPVGYPLTTCLFLAALFRLGRRSSVGTGVLAIVVGLGSWGLFAYLLRVPLPAGYWWR